MTWSDRFREEVAKLGLELSEEQLQAFERFHEALYAANSVMNLTRVAPEEAWLRHYLDSLLVQRFIPQGSKVLDLGTGPGFPAWPLACARPDLKVTAVDSSGKMVGFLRTQALPNLVVEQVRAEDWGVRDRFDVVTGRAIAPLPIQLELSGPPCKVGGAVIPMRTPNESFEGIGESRVGLELRTVAQASLADTEIVRAFPIYEKITRSERRYPRRWAEIKAKPLY